MVGFYGNYGSSQRGVYLYNGDSLLRVADYTTLSPGGSQNFSEFQTGRGGILNGKTYFQGSYTTSSGTWSGIHAYNSGTGALERVTGRGVAYPELGGNVTQVSYVLARGGNITISASRTSGLNNYGGYLRTDGTTLTAAVDSSQTGGQPFSIGPYATNGSRITLQEIAQFHTFDANGAITSFNLSTTQVPGRSFNFTGGWGAVPALTADETFFTANSSVANGSIRGLYRMNADGTGPVSLVADSSTLFPGHHDNLNFFGAISANDDSLAFVAHPDTARGIFLYHAGQISTIIDNLSPLDGRNISSFSISEAGLSDEGLAFRVVFSDATQAIYYTSLTAIPEPSTWALLLGLGTLGLVLIRRWAGRS